MLDSAAASLLAMLGDPKLLGLIALAVLIGMFFGVVPGMGGKLGIVLLIPFVFGMDMVAGAVFLLAMHAVVHTGGSIPSILLGIPGEGPCAATVVDGYPMTKNGEAGRALGASLAASAVGGVIGAVFFAAMLPLLEPVVLAFSPAEFFLLAVLGITFIAGLSGESLLKGLVVGCLGLMLAMVGLNPHTGEPRFTLGLLSLWDGVDLITAVLALFAIPEMVELGVAGGSVAGERAEPARYRLRQVIQGMGDIVTHRWLTLRTSLIGAFIGLIPGLGGDAASWICYGHAVQSSKTPERFGHGAVEGVIAPETANNAKEGGALLPTLFFGVPGSSGMVIMLGAFVMLGIQPGPGVLINQPDLIWTLIWALVLSNLFAVVVFLACAQQLSLIAHLRGDILIPLVFCLAVLSSLLSTGNWQHLIVLMVLGALGCGLKRYGWPRPPFAIGIVLGSITETSLYQALSIWGLSFFLRPGALILLALTAGSVGFYFWRTRTQRRASAAPESGGAAASAGGSLAVGAAVATTFALMLAETVTLSPAARLMPLAVGIPALLFAVSQMGLDLRAWRLQAKAGTAAASMPSGGTHETTRFLALFGWFFALIVLSILLGLLVAFPLFVFLFLWWSRAGKPGFAALIAAGFAAVIYGLFDKGMGLTLWEGLLPPLLF